MQQPRESRPPGSLALPTRRRRWRATRSGHRRSSYRTVSAGAVGFSQLFSGINIDVVWPSVTQRDLDTHLRWRLNGSKVIRGITFLATDLSVCAESYSCSSYYSTLTTTASRVTRPRMIHVLAKVFSVDNFARTCRPWRHLLEKHGAANIGGRL